MKEEIIIRGKTVRVARLLKNVSIQQLAEMTGINDNYLAKMEREVEGVTISYRNYFRLLRVLRDELKYTDAELVAITILVENINEWELDI